MSDIQVTSVDGSQINVSTGPLAGPLPELQIAAGSGITVDSKNGVSTISANLPELSIPANLADLTDVSAGATSGQVLSYNGTSWGGLTLAIPANLADLSNVNGTPTTGQVLAWGGSSWAPADDQTGGSSNVANLADLTDVSSVAPSTGQALVWSGSEWAGGNIPPGTTVNGLSGAVNLVSGDNVAITVDGQNLTIASVGGGDGVTAVNGLTGSLTLAAGDGVTIANSGSTITLNATADLTGYATETYVDSAVANLVNGSPAALDTLAELSAALNNDSDFAANVTTLIAQKADANHTHVKANITDLTTGDLDMQGNRVLFANYYATQADFPDPSVYHGMVAHSHADGAFYGAHAGAWVRLANQSEIPAATSVNTLTGDITLVAGDNINVTSSGQNITITGQQAGIVWQTPPQNGSSPGNAGDIAYDDNFLYLRTSQAWRQVALSPIATSITISQQPSNQSVNDGDTATFTVLATAGGETITYQWEQSSDNGSTFSDISGATSNSLAVTANLTLDGYQYRASLAAPGAADVTTSVATLTVAETFDILAENGDRLTTEGGDSIDHDGIGSTLTITSQPQNTTASGGEASFAVAATVSDGSALTYQWQEEALAGGVTWTQRTLPAYGSWSSVAYGSGTFVAVTDNNNIAATSPDGITWTQRTLPVSADWTVTHGNGTFVAVARGTNIAVTSTNGATWTQQTIPVNALWDTVSYGNGTFVAMSGSYGVAATSPDGITWTQRALPEQQTVFGLTYGNGTFVAVEYVGNTALTSPDGITWTQRTLPATAYWIDTAYGNGTFVAVASDYLSDIAATSPDGITWTQRTLPPTGGPRWSSVAYGDGTFVAVSTLYSNIAATSPDGVTWTQRAMPAPADWFAVTYGNGTFVAVPFNNNIAATSESTLQFLSLSGETASTLNLTGLTTADDGERYRVVVDSPSVEPVTSDVATLSVPVELAWTQVGSDIDGGAAGNELGPVALNSNGTVMVVGEPGHDSGGFTNYGRVAVYADNGTAWVQRGMDIVGDVNLIELGTTVSISDDGNAVAISSKATTGVSSSQKGLSRFAYNGTAWNLSPSSGLNLGYNFGGISGDGSTVAAIHSPSGLHLVVYDATGSSFSQYGSQVFISQYTLASWDYGGSVALNNDGTVVAAGVGLIGSTNSIPERTGFVSVWEWTGSVWALRGSDVITGTGSASVGVIAGDQYDDQFGGSVSLTSNGNRLAVGAPYGDAGGTDRGYVRVYDWNGSAWSQVGGDITGVNNYDYAGWSVDISSDGSRVVVGLRGGDANGSNSGTTRIYDWSGSAWVQVGGDINGSAANDYSGTFVTISGDGTRVGIGAPGNDDGGADAGQVRVFEVN